MREAFLWSMGMTIHHLDDNLMRAPITFTCVFFTKRIIKSPDNADYETKPSRLIDLFMTTDSRILLQYCNGCSYDSGMISIRFFIEKKKASRGGGGGFEGSEHLAHCKTQKYIYGATSVKTLSTLKTRLL